MYIPSAYREEDFDQLLAFMRANNMATVVSVLDGAPFATHLPIVVRIENETTDKGTDKNSGLSSLTLSGHFARANPHWRAFASADTSTGRAQDSPECLVIFSGPHAYISPSLYENRESVPTWNFMAVHAYGRPRILTAEEAYAHVRGLLEEMIATFEASYLEQWQSLSEQYRDGMMQGLVAFEMPVTRLEGKFKLSQNRPLVDQHSVAQAVLEYEDPVARRIGEAMHDNLKRRSA